MHSITTEYKIKLYEDTWAIITHKGLDIYFGKVDRWHDVQKNMLLLTRNNVIVELNKIYLEEEAKLKYFHIVADKIMKEQEDKQKIALTEKKKE